VPGPHGAWAEARPSSSPSGVRPRTEPYQRATRRFATRRDTVGRARAARGPAGASCAVPARCPRAPRRGREVGRPGCVSRLCKSTRIRQWVNQWPVCNFMMVKCASSELALGVSVGGSDGGCVGPAHPDGRLRYYNKERSPVTRSISELFAGPIVPTVTEPAATSVRPASATRSVGNPRASACARSMSS
jgi:hypothetical protein